ncbi:MAG: gliding motility protein GldN [Lentimicrobiaceae bacterium]|jgi:gliding motility associated protien GldN|nr:gliding motility protein GldN [Lentimicrobiaceae bacterium]
MKKFIISVFSMLFLCSLAQNELVAQTNIASPLDGIYYEDSTGFRDPIPYPPIRMADVMWKKRIWREIDFRQKINQPFYYPTEPHNNWKNIITILLDAWRNGDIEAYEVTPTDEFLNPLVYSQFIRMFEIERTTQIEDPLTGEIRDTVFVTTFDRNAVMRLRLKEDWYFDKQRSQLMVRIIAICPVMIQEVAGSPRITPLFWVPFNQLRETLARSYVFNRHNSAERRTYDEVFWKRMFDSYIYKEENVYDRAIADYASGIDILYESERIKNEMFNFEQNLWDY